MRTASRTMKANLRWWLLGLVAAGCAACRPPEAEPRRTGKESSAMKLTSKAFEDGTTIPVQHTGDGADVSPPLQWGGAPPRGKGRGGVEKKRGGSFLGGGPPPPGPPPGGGPPFPPPGGGGAPRRG